RSAADAAELNQAVLETAQDAYIAVDGAGIVQSWNPEATVLFGFEPEEAIGRQIADLIIPAEDRVAHKERRDGLVAQATHGGRIEPYEVWVQDKDGRKHLIE